MWWWNKKGDFIKYQNTEVIIALKNFQIVNTIQY